MTLTGKIKWLREEAIDLFDFVRAYITFAFRPNYVRRKWVGSDDLAGATRVVVFNHFDKRGIVHDYVLYYLQELRRAGFTVIFTSNSPRFPTASVERLTPLVAVILWRSNVGYDFGAFKDGVAQIPDVTKLDQLLITNDSIYGPVQDLAEVIANADPRQGDVWGITDCWARYYHLQSYFLLFHPRALQNPAFSRFWRRLPYFRRKEWVVQYGEVGLTQSMMKYGLECRALYPYRAMVARVSGSIETYLETADPKADSVRYRYLEMVNRFLREGVTLNQTHFFWDELLVTSRCPFIKRDLLQRNPIGVPYLQHWERMLGEISSYDTRLIVRHLEYSMQNRVY